MSLIKSFPALIISTIAEKRIEKAIEYMKDENVNLTEIAFLTGYDDYTYFSKVFKKITGKSPRDYRIERK